MRSGKINSLVQKLFWTYINTLMPWSPREAALRVRSCKWLKGWSLWLLFVHVGMLPSPEICCWSLVSYSRAMSLLSIRISWRCDTRFTINTCFSFVRLLTIYYLLVQECDHTKIHLFLKAAPVAEKVVAWSQNTSRSLEYVHISLFPHTACPNSEHKFRAF